MAPVEDAKAGELTFVASEKYRHFLSDTKASAVILPPGMPAPEGLAVVRATDPEATVLGVLKLLDPGPPLPPEGQHANAVVASSAEVASGVRMGPGIVIEDGVRVGKGSILIAGVHLSESCIIGEECVLYPGVFIGRECVLGNRVTVQPGAVVGSDGFGYAPVGKNRYEKIPQLGIVEIGDDVEIGANACIDRATMGATRIGAGTKIDNMVHIAHNVSVGEGGAIAALTGVAGSTRIGDGIRTGGQAGFAGHLRIGDHVTLAGRAGVTANVADGMTVSGFPARGHRETLRAEAALRRLPETLKELRAASEKHAPEPSDGSES
jgi:UDP-3-O-[3-hydroxymyristoyl] glucosamine N-acyltransferase